VNMLDWDPCSRRKGRPAAGPRGHHATGPLKLAAEIPTSEGKLQLASVLDIGSRRVLGFGLSDHHDAGNAYGALAMAVAVLGGQVPGVIFHTDQGRVTATRTVEHTHSAAATSATPTPPKPPPHYGMRSRSTSASAGPPPSASRKPCAIMGTPQPQHTPAHGQESADQRRRPPRRSQPGIEQQLPADPAT
jgi:hypothetical protein